MDELMRLKAAAREEGSDYLTWNDIQACIDQVNLTVQEEHERKRLTLASVHTQILYPTKRVKLSQILLYPCHPSIHLLLCLQVLPPSA